MDPKKKKDTAKEVFSKEYEKLEFYKDQLNNESLNAAKLRNFFHDLVMDYESLLSDAVKITRIGDVSQLKLLKAKEQIEELNNKLVESERNVRELNTILMFYIKATDK